MAETLSQRQECLWKRYNGAAAPSFLMAAWSQIATATPRSIWHKRVFRLQNRNLQKHTLWAGRGEIRQANNWQISCMCRRLSLFQPSNSIWWSSRLLNKIFSIPILLMCEYYRQDGLPCVHLSCPASSFRPLLVVSSPLRLLPGFIMEFGVFCPSHESLFSAYYSSFSGNSFPQFTLSKPFKIQWTSYHSLVQLGTWGEARQGFISSPQLRNRAFDHAGLCWCFCCSSLHPAPLAHATIPSLLHIYQLPFTSIQLSASTTLHNNSHSTDQVKRLLLDLF